jgi:hypothetical protein
LSMNKIILLMTIFTIISLSGCKQADDNTDSGVGTPIPPVTQQDPTTFNWNIQGAASGQTETCIGPYFAVSNTALDSDYVLTLTVQNTQTTLFYKGADCGTSEVETSVTVHNGNFLSDPFYIGDTTNSVNEIVVLGITAPGQEDPLTILTVSMSQNP